VGGATGLQPTSRCYAIAAGARERGGDSARDRADIPRRAANREVRAGPARPGERASGSARPSSHGKGGSGGVSAGRGVEGAKRVHLSPSAKVCPFQVNKTVREIRFGFLRDVKLQA
jgi:hypothetical protein